MPTKYGTPPKIQNVHTVFVKWRTFFRWCVDEGYIEQSPMNRLKGPRLDNRLLPAFDERELRLLDVALAGSDFAWVRARAIVYVLLDSACRLQECTDLRVSDGDLSTGSLRIRMGKGRKERISCIGHTTARVLGRYVRMAKVGREDALWICEKGPLTKSGINQVLQEVDRASGLHLHTHKLRRTCALQMLRNGCDVYSLQALVGREDLATLRKYLAQTESDVASAHTKFGVMDRLRYRR